MRLLVYGGTGYYERQRIGSWETISREALEDTYGLPQDKNIYGVGLPDNQPALIFRQRQQTETVRSYAYTLLLDPGRNIWERFGWNGAAFAQVLFEDAHETAERLLKNPEGLYLDTLEKVLHGLMPREDIFTFSQKSFGGIDVRQALWIGATFDSSLLDIPLSAFEFKERPNFSEMAKFISSMPQSFRTGFGWIVGGSGQNGRCLGAKFALDGAVDETHSTEKLIVLGRQIFEAVQTIANHEGFEEFNSKPLWEWTEKASVNSEQVAHRLILLAEILKDSSFSKTSLSNVINTLSETPFLEREIRRAAQGRAFSKGEKLTDKHTNFVLQNHLSFDLPLEGNLSLLDEKTVAKKFLEEDLDHTKLQHFPLTVRDLVWQSLLARTRSNEDVPSLLFSAIDDFEGCADNLIPSLVQIVRQRMRHTNFSLHYWRNYRRHRHWHLVEVILAETALERAAQNTEGWEFEYLLFAKDDGGKRLFNIKINKEKLRATVQNFVSHLRTNGDFALEARRWLSALADSEIRRGGVLSFTDKIGIAESVGDRWLYYSALWNAYYNRPETCEISQAPSDRELWLLRNELNELVEKDPAQDFVPDLRRLKKLLGTVSEEAFEIFENLSPNFSGAEDASIWVSSFTPTNPVKAAKETVRYLLECDDTAPANWLFPKFDEIELANLFETLLFKPHPTRNDRYRNRLEELLKITQEKRRLAGVVNRVFRAGIKNGIGEFFCKRFASEPNVLRLLTFYLSTPARSSLMDILAHYYQGYFVQEAVGIWKTAINKKEPLTPFEFALFTYLKSVKGKRTLSAVGQVLEKEWFRGELVDVRLDTILQNGVIEELYFADDEEIYETESLPDRTKSKMEVYIPIEEKESMFVRVKKFFGFGLGNEKDKNRSEHPETETKQNETLPEEHNPRF